MKYKNQIKSQKGSITLYVLISMMFFLFIVLGIYINTSNKIQKQEKEIEKIQKEYEKEDINDIYEEICDDYVNIETPTIQAYDGETLKGEVIGEKVSSKKTIYLSNKNVKLKFLSKNTSDKYAYSTTANGEKIKIEGNTLDIDITTSGKTIYVYVEDNNGNYSENYTAVTMILVTLQDKTIYVEEGKDTKIGEIQGENAGEITFGQVEDSSIIKLEGDTVTGINAGTTTLIATEEKAGATATITVKVVKIKLAATSGTMILGDSRTVKITGINNGTLSVKSSDEETATVSLNNNEIIITAKKAGNATITVTENNVKATATYEIKIASVALEPNGGTYTMPTEGNATIKTTVTTENAEKIEIQWSDNAEEWTVIENNKLVEKTDCTAQVYYLYVRINGEAIYKSKEFVVGENTLDTNKITITPSTTNWTNGNITATVTYGSTLTANKKAGYGTNLSAAQTAASTSTATSLTATANGYFYAEATDTAGNKVTASLQITNIDKTLPTVTLSPNGGTYTMPTSGKATIKTKLTAADTGGSGLKTLQYAWSTSNTTAPTTWTTFTNGNEVSKTDCTAGTYYLWTNVIDNAGNTATSVRTSNAFTITANQITIEPSTTAWTKGNVTATVTYGSTLTANKKAGYGTNLANAQTAASTSTATSLTATANGYFYAEATDAVGNKVTSSLQITNIDKTKPNAPSITVSSGTVGKNGYYRSNVVVKITAGSDSQSGVDKTTYVLSGATSKGETKISSGGTITISNEGNTTITAYTYDKVGNKSSAATLTVKKDTIAPNITAIFSENGSQALVRMTVTDYNSGVISLQTSGNHSYSSGTSTTGKSTMTYDMYVSTDGTTTITAIDMAGNTSTKTHNIKFLFTYNNKRTENTGGWSQNYHYNLFGDVINVSYASGESLAILAQPTPLDAGRLGSWYTNNSISLSGYDTIRSVSFFDKNSTGTIWLGLSGDVRDEANIDKAKAQNDYNGSTGYWVRLTSDISSINDSRQCMIGTNGEKSAYVYMFLANMYMYSFK